MDRGPQALSYQGSQARLAIWAGKMGYKPVPGISGVYVSKEGIVYSTRIGDAFRPLKPRKIGHCYYVDLGPRTANLAELVAICFVQNPNRYTSYLHLNRDRADCRAENLLWVEATRPYSKNELTPSDILAIEGAKGIKNRAELAEEFNIPISRVSVIWAQARRRNRDCFSKRHSREQRIQAGSRSSRRGKTG